MKPAAADGGEGEDDDDYDYDDDDDDGYKDEDDEERLGCKDTLWFPLWSQMKSQ